VYTMVLAVFISKWVIGFGLLGWCITEGFGIKGMADSVWRNVYPFAFCLGRYERGLR
jgi:hypothetical protein